jgi:uncharacterized protein (DUF849 family)
MLPTTDRVPHVPVTVDRIVDDAIACADAGASIVHLHARDEREKPVWQRGAYAEMLVRIREQRPDLVLCVTTSGRTFPDIEKRTDVLRLEGDARPDMASLTLGSLNFATGPSITSPRDIEALAGAMREAGVRPELEVFDSGMAAMVRHLADRGVIEPPFYVNVLLGSVGTAPARLHDLAHIVDMLPHDAVWAAAGIGIYQLTMNGIAILAGGHVRTGLEDNPFLDWASRTPATNPALVARCAEIARLAGREVATPAEVRRWLDLRPAGR